MPTTLIFSDPGGTIRPASFTPAAITEPYQ
jgi:hypothetical protein